MLDNRRHIFANGYNFKYIEQCKLCSGFLFDVGHFIGHKLNKMSMGLTNIIILYSYITHIAHIAHIWIITNIWSSSPPAIYSLKSKSNTQLLHQTCNYCLYLLFYLLCSSVHCSCKEGCYIFDVYFIFEQNVKNKRKIWSFIAYMKSMCLINCLRLMYILLCSVYSLYGKSQ